MGITAPIATVDAAKKGEVKIKKCRDAQGKWHYGDHAAAECARSKVIEMSGAGIRTKVDRAPATEEELQERARQETEAVEERKRAAEQARRDKQLMATYGHEDDIKYIRDRKLAQIESTIAATTETLKPLRAALARMEAEVAKAKSGGKAGVKEAAAQITKTKAQIARHEAAMAAKRREQEAIRNQAEADLKRYRELKASQPR